jgi:hypothetical protein
MKSIKNATSVLFLNSIYDNVHTKYATRSFQQNFTD